jgi:uncharacterized membrane protein YfcA
MLVWIALLSGIITGITGIQYGILVPALLLTGILPNIKIAVGTVLYAFLPPTSILSVYYLYKHGQVDIQKGNQLMVVLLFSILLGSKISTYLSARMIQWITAWLLLGLSMFFFSLCFHIVK